MTIPTKIRPPTERLQLIQEAAKVEQEEWQHRCIIHLFIIPCYSPLINPSPQKAWPLLSCLGKCHPSERVWDTAGERKDKFSVCILISLTSAYLLLWKWGNSGEAERAGPATCRLLWQLMWIWPHYCWQVWEKKPKQNKTWRTSAIYCEYGKKSLTFILPLEHLNQAARCKRGCQGFFFVFFCYCNPEIGRWEYSGAEAFTVTVH